MYPYPEGIYIFEEVTGESLDIREEYIKLRVNITNIIILHNIYILKAEKSILTWCKIVEVLRWLILSVLKGQIWLKEIKVEIQI